MVDRDVDVLRFIGSFRIVTTEHIASFFFSHSKVSIKRSRDVLRRLRIEGYIKSFQRSKSESYVHILSKKGMNLLNHRYKIKPYSETRNHTLGVTDIGSAFLKKYGGHSWIEVDHGPVITDLVVQLEEIRSVLFIEYQRSEIKEKTFKERIQGYEKVFHAAEWESGWNYLDPIEPRLLFVTNQRFKYESRVPMDLITKEEVLNRLKL